MSPTTIERRLSELEREVADLKSRLSDSAAPQHSWLSAVTGSMTDEADFNEAVELGRAIRQADFIFVG